MVRSEGTQDLHMRSIRAGTRTRTRHAHMRTCIIVSYLEIFCDSYLSRPILLIFIKKVKGTKEKNTCTPSGPRTPKQRYL